MRVEHAARSHVGLVRQRNEDAWSAWPGREAGEAEGALFLFGVADGMGGHPGGDVASSSAVSVLHDLGPSTWGSPRAHLREIFRQAHRRIEEAALRDPTLQQMGTTLTVACFRDGVVWAGQIGDSRLYWIRDREVRQLTRDHTLAQDLVESGALSPQEAEDHYASHVLTRCLGVCPDHAPDLLWRPLRARAKDRFLLASDGLAKTVRPDALAGLLSQGTAAEAVAALEQAALATGAPDNVTVLLVRVIDPGEAKEVETIAFEQASSLHWTRA
jgi:protein phosphatase